MTMTLNNERCSHCHGEIGDNALVIEHGSAMDGDLAYEYVCGACAALDEKLRHLVKRKKEKAMRTKAEIDDDRMDAFETLIMWFAILGLGGVVYLLARVAMTSFAAVRDWLALVIFPAVMFVMSALALGTCVKWAIWG